MNTKKSTQKGAVNSRNTLYRLTPIMLIGVFFCLLGFTPEAEAAWYGASWTNRQKITIGSAMTPNTDQTDFPVLIKLTDGANVLFSTAQADGDDILFTASDGTTKLSHEIEDYDATASSETLIA